jgi:protein-tyrosine phosphatase
MAEFVMKDLVKKAGLESQFEIASCATSIEEIGNHIYPPAKAELSQHNIRFDKEKCAVQLKKSDYDKYDLFVVMDTNNVRNIRRIFGVDPDNKVRKLLEFAGRSDDVSDPWYSRRFDVAYADILEGCEGLLDELNW